MPQYPQYQLSLFEEKRNQLVVKSNSLIQKTRFSLSAQQQKILLYIISKIKPADDDLKRYIFDLKEFCRVCGIEEHGQNYKNFKESIKALRDNSFWLETESKDFLISWLEEVEINKDETTVSLRLDERLKPYLLHIREKFTAFEFGTVLLMKGKYSIRLYEILKSYEHLLTISFSLMELKELLNSTDYTDYRNFRRNVLEKAIKEINEYTDLIISYNAKLKGRAVSDICFTISKKTDDEIAMLRLEREGRLYNG